MKEIFCKQKEQRIFFSGDLTRETIDTIFEQKTLNLLHSSYIELDFEEVQQIDTAGLAWLLMMVEKAQQNSCQIALFKTPTNLMNLAKLSAVDCFLPIA